MAFAFIPSPHFVNTGAETAASQLEDVAEDVSLLRRHYPELAQWGDLALETAWGSYSQQVNLISWEPVTARDEDFLNFCCWEQTRGEFLWGDDRDKLAQANDWQP